MLTTATLSAWARNSTPTATTTATIGTASAGGTTAPITATSRTVVGMSSRSTFATASAAVATTSNDNSTGTTNATTAGDLISTASLSRNQPRVTQADSVVDDSSRHHSKNISGNKGRPTSKYVFAKTT